MNGTPLAQAACEVGKENEMGKPTQILIVDDDKELRLAVKDVLTEQGYNVTTVGDGAQALRYLEHMHGMDARLPALILLDLEMPVMNGREFLANHAEQAAFVKIPVVICSGNDTVPEASKVAAVLAKPFKVTDLLAIVSRATGGPCTEPESSPRAA
jgi:two-component system response regulator CpxR